jgi:hypothetical protein
MAINYRVFARMMHRANEVANQAGIPSIIVRVYKERLEGAAQTYLTANAALDTATGLGRKETTEAKAALDAIDKPYAVARAATLAYVPHLVLPETLKAVRTDTDKMDAIETLHEVLEANATAGWAQDLLAGDFGKLAPKTVQEIDEAIHADATLAAARKARAEAYGRAYDEYLSFKRVVRSACGSSSREYRRIHLKSFEPGQPEEPVEPTPVNPTPGPTPPPA